MANCFLDRMVESARGRKQLWGDYPEHPEAKFSAMLVRKAEECQRNPFLLESCEVPLGAAFPDLYPNAIKQRTKDFGGGEPKTSQKDLEKNFSRALWLLRGVSAAADRGDPTSPALLDTIHEFITITEEP